MKLQKIKRIFFNWLKVQRAYEAYKLARHNTNHLLGENRITNPYYRRHLECHKLINQAFTWEQTREGWAFWNRLHRKWINYLSKIETDLRYQ